MYIDSLACVRVQWDESEWFRIVGCIMSPWLFNVYGWSNGGGEDGDAKEGSKISGGWERVEIAWPLVCR